MAKGKCLYSPDTSAYTHRRISMTRQHPCSPLTAQEIERVAGIVRSDTTHTVGERTRFVLMEVREPDKDVVASAELGGESPPRDVRVMLLDRDARDGAGTTYEVTVRLDDDAVVDWREIAGVQPLSDVRELSEAEDLLRDDPTFQAALRRRGVTDFSTVQVDAWPGGN